MYYKYAKVTLEKMTIIYHFRFVVVFLGSDPFIVVPFESTFSVVDSYFQNR